MSIILHEKTDIVFVFLHYTVNKFYVTYFIVKPCLQKKNRSSFFSICFVFKRNYCTVQYKKDKCEQNLNLTRSCVAEKFISQVLYVYTQCIVTRVSQYVSILFHVQCSIFQCFHNQASSFTSKIPKTKKLAMCEFFGSTR